MSITSIIGFGPIRSVVAMLYSESSSSKWRVVFDELTGSFRPACTKTTALCELQIATTTIATKEIASAGAAGDSSTSSPTVADAPDQISGEGLGIPNALLVTSSASNSIQMSVTSWISDLPLHVNGGGKIDATLFFIAPDGLTTSGNAVIGSTAARQVQFKSAPPVVSTPVELSDFRPGGRLAKAAGQNYRAVDKSECVDNVWKPKSPSGLVYVPCGVVVPFQSSTNKTRLTVAAEGPITIEGSIQPFVKGLALVTSSNEPKSIDVSGNIIEINGALLSNGGLKISSTLLALQCGFRVATVEAEITSAKLLRDQIASNQSRRKLLRELRVWLVCHYVRNSRRIAVEL